MRRHERRRAVEKAAMTLRITDVLDRKPRQLSGGEQQRVALGRAMVRNPQVFLMDEPLTNLDADMRVEMRAELKLLQQTLRSTMIYVTHDQVEAMSLGDRMVVMNEGRLEQVGTPLEVYDRPASLFTASFIGSPPDKSRPSLDRGRGACRASWASPGGSPTGSIARLNSWRAFRPEAFELVAPRYRGSGAMPGARIRSARRRDDLSCRGWR